MLFRSESGWIVDPSAASFIQALRARGRRVIEADNEVLDGIRMVSTLIGKRRLMVHKRCINLLKEINGYVWDESSVNGKERPLKFNDHACLSGDTLIATEQGNIPIKELVGTKGKLQGISGKVGYDNVTCTGTKELYRFTTESGKIIIATKDHPVLTKQGWKPISEAEEVLCL